ncbi:MAG: BTAD domain-containing putative transcriptional regulator [Solirubrobacterales bacterium]
MEFRVLGPFEVRRDDQALALGGAKQRALLAILLIEANHVVGLDRLAELLWRHDPPATSNHIIEVYVSQLRRVLEPAGAPYRVLVRKPSGYMLQVAPEEVDSAGFQKLVEDAGSAPPEQAEAQLTRALAMWRGPALADFATEPFAVSEAAQLDELRLHAREELIHAGLAQGRHGRLIGELRALVEGHPLRERLCGQLMLALYRSGRQAEASDVYQRTRQRLVDELGMEPGPDLQALLKKILQQDSSLAAAPGRPASSTLPSGTVTFLLTDLEGSTRRWDRNPAEMRQAMVVHDEVLGRLVTAHGGLQVESGREGDSMFAAFTRASDAVGCAVAAQRAFAAQAWPAGADLHVRIAINSGEAELRAGHYYGPAVYRCARVLVTGYGDQVLLTQAARDLAVDALPTGVGFRDLGSHRLRDLERPEHVFQVVGLGLRAEFPPLKSMDPRRHNLPVSPTGFVGRGPELAEIQEMLAANRMLTLIGAGGTGKTRLALQAAAEMIDGFRDGVWLVELASISEPELVAQTAAETLGVREEAGRPILKTLSEWLREKNLLLLLDNCEHLIPAVVGLADRLLRDCRDLRLLTTSRAALRVDGEAVLRIGPLPEPDAVVLFADRSSAAQRAFHLTDDNAGSVVQICRRVEGIPLAIELAAGRARMMTPAEILAKLQQSFAVLAGGTRSADSRHETMRTAMDWSYWLLNEEEQRLFRRLSVFTRGFTLEAAEFVGGSDGAGTIELVGQLVDKSLVTPHESVDRTTRYSILETVKEYAQGRLLEHGELEVTHRRHAAYFAQLVEVARTRLTGPERKKWLRILGVDVDNLRSVFESSTVAPQTALALAAGLAEFWEARGEYSEGRTRLDAALAQNPEPSRTRSEALQAAGLLACLQGDQSAASGYTDQALTLSRSLRDTEGEARCLQQLGQIAVQSEDFAAAPKYLTGALEIATRHGYGQVQAYCEWRLGLVAMFTKDMVGAAAHFQTSLDLSRRIGDVETEAMSLLMLGNISLRQNRIDEARSQLRESLVIQRLEGSSRSVANLIESLAAVAVAEGQTDRALRLGGAAEGLRTRIEVVSTSPLHREISRRLQPMRQGADAQRGWLAGAAMSREEAIGYALEEVEADSLNAEG